MEEHTQINIDKPLWSQDSFYGRFMYFLWVTDPRTCLVSDKHLDEAKQLLNNYRNENIPSNEILYAKKLYESAFHPDSGEKMNFLGRMSFQLPGGMAITGILLQFYKTVPQVVFCQWINQSFNAFVNYTNRNTNSPTTKTQMFVAYVSATTAAVAAAIGFKGYLQKRASTFFQRYVPFAAVAAANFVNIPLMRQNELLHGVNVVDENNRVIGQSQLAAFKGITQVVISRIVMCAPGMLITPIFMEKLEKFQWMKRIKVLHAPIQVMFVGCFLSFMVPVACALYPQKCSLNVSTIKMFEPEQYEKIKNECESKLPQKVFFNKGL